MTILIHLGNQLMAEAVYQLLVAQGYDGVVVNGRSPTNGAAPDVLFVDTTTLSHGLFTQYPEAKVLLIDAGIEPDKLCAMLLSYRIHGVLSPHTELQLLKKALTALTEGQIWIDNGSVKAMLQEAGDISRKGKIDHITGREQEIIECIYEGLSNREIARKLGISDHTVKAHLARIFRKFNVTTRSKLIALAMHGRPTSG